MSATSHPQREKRADIQVLRGVAVLAVVLFHLNFPYLSGGFLGVDIFFVISGFVITETILRSTGTLKSRISHFYLRRAKRILPVATFVAVITFLGSIIFLPRPYFSKYVFDSIASLLMVSNAGFAHQNLDYLNQGLNPSPFLHYWSLAVEEQFYLVWPIVLIVVVRNRRRLLYLALPPLFLLAVLTTHVKPGFSYLSPSSRAWEFLVGAVLVFLPKRTLSQVAHKILFAVATGGLLLSFLIVSRESATPSFSTALPVLSVALLIYGGFASNSLKIVEWVGDISYSLYLVHWPLIILADAIWQDQSFLRGVLLFSLSIALANLVSRAIEAPFRYGKLKVATKHWIISGAISACAILLLASFTGFLSAGKDRGFAIDASSPIIYALGCHVETAIPKVKGCDFGETKASRRVILAGDSHAGQYFPGLNVAAKRADYKLTSLTKPACPAISLDDRPAKRDAQCREWEQRLISTIKELKPEILVLTNFTERADLQDSLGMTTGDYIASFIEFVNAVKKSVGKIVYVGDSPFPGEDSIACLTREHRHPARCDIRNTKVELTKLIEQEVHRLNLSFIDSRSFLCGKNVCKAVVDEKNMYRDTSHISVHIYEKVARGLAGVFKGN